MTTARGFFLDGQTQMGLAGSDREVLQQRHEAVEGYVASRRWLSGEPRIPEILQQPLCANSKGKSTYQGQACQTKTGEAKLRSRLCILSQELPYEECSLKSPNVGGQARPWADQLEIMRDLRRTSPALTTDQERMND